MVEKQRGPQGKRGPENIGLGEQTPLGYGPAPAEARPAFNPAPPRPGSPVTPSGPGVVIAERGRGHLVVVQSCLVGAKSYPMASIGVWWTLPDGQHAPDRKSCLIHLHEVPALIEALMVLVAQESTPAPAKVARSIQDRALVLLADGLGPNDLPARLWPGEPSKTSRLAALGKNLRKAGFLVPGDWILTPEGEARVHGTTSTPATHSLGTPSFTPSTPTAGEVR